MTDRIKYVDEKTVNLKMYHADSMALLEVHVREDGSISFAGWQWDGPGLVALSSAIAAYQRDGDFRSFRPTPTYRPYNSEEMQALVGKVLRHKATQEHRLILGFSPGSEFEPAPHVMSARYVPINAEALQEAYEHLDGSPCGVLESPLEPKA